MPYKIVQTIQKGTLVLASVPDSWENGGVLFWPPENKNEEVFINGDSPGHDWTRLFCVVKKKNISTFEAAGMELKKMCEHNDLESKIDNLSENVQNIIENQKTLHQNQQNISYELVKLNNTLENLITSCSAKGATFEKKISFKPMETAKDLETLENKLKDEAYKAYLELNFSNICGKQDGAGVNAAYKLVDFIFTRELMAQCSWSGGSRTDDRKLCFKSYQRTIGFFFDLVKSSDRFFTLEECENFFKKVLKNAKQRTQFQQMRMSTMRRTGKRKKKMDIEIIENDESDVKYLDRSRLSSAEKAEDSLC